MNWMGGARARARKGGVVRRQREYFAKKRTAETYKLYMGNSSSPSRADEDHAGRKRKQVLQEFDIVVAAQQDKGNRPLAKKLLGSDGEYEIEVPNPKRRKDVEQEEDGCGRTEKENIKSRKVSLLEKRDWVCTMNMPAPPKPAAKPKEVENRRAPFQLPKATPVPPYRRERASQTVTDIATDFRDHPDTDFNAYLPLSGDGYVRIGKGRLGPEVSIMDRDSAMEGHSMEARTIHRRSRSRVSDPFRLSSRVEHRKRELSKANTLRKSSYFHAVPSAPISSPVHGFDTSPYSSQSRSLDLGEHFPYAQEYPSSSPRLPRRGTRLLSRHVRDDVHRQRAYEADKATEYGPLPQFGSRTEKRPLTHSQSSPTTRVSHYVSRGIDEQYFEEDHNEETYAEESELSEPMPVNLSVIGHVSSSGGVLSSDVQQKSEASGTYLGNPPLEDAEGGWSAFLNESSDRGSQENRDGVSMMGYRGTIAEIEVGEDPLQFFDRVVLGEGISMENEQGPNHGDRLAEDERPAALLPIKVDNNATWKTFLRASTEEASRNALVFNASDISVGSAMLPAPKSPTPKSPPIRLSPTRDENQAWHAFILPTYPDSNDDEDYVPKQQNRRNWKT